VFVLTTAETCSASEALVNGLRGFIEVVTIGARTCGKPVGYSPVDFRGFTYAVISFYVENRDGAGRYFDGLPPTCPVQEDFSAELGSPEDPLMRAALGYIRGEGWSAGSP
jgi:hypothetical protein